jgi:hypothetical protein
LLSLKATGKQPNLNLIRRLESSAPGALLSKMIEGALFDPGFPFIASLKLLHRPYWERVWIIQEFCVSSELFMLCGAESMNYALFLRAILFLSLLMEKCISIPDIILAPQFQSFCRSPQMPKTALMLANKRAYYRQREYLTLLGNVSVHTLDHIGNRAKASDPRDKIFALLGIASDAVQLAKYGVVPDYNKPCSLVYTETARAIIEMGNVDLLAFNQFPKTETLPSWVPDWRAKIVTPGAQLRSQMRFAASGNRLSRKRGIFTLLAGSFTSILSLSKFASPIQKSNTQELRLEGCLVDKIEAVGNLGRLDLDDNKTVEEHVIDYLKVAGEFYERPQAKFEGMGKDIYKSKLDRASSYFRFPISDQLPDPDLLGPYQHPLLSSTGYLGISAADVKEGDSIVIFLGGKYPYIIRDTSDGTYTLIREVYVHGIMYGEFMDGNVEIQKFVLV